MVIHPEGGTCGRHTRGIDNKGGVTASVVTRRMDHHRARHFPRPLFYSVTFTTSIR